MVICLIRSSPQRLNRQIGYLAFAWSYAHEIKLSKRYLPCMYLAYCTRRDGHIENGDVQDAPACTS